jgi:hypothetical protein
LALPSKKLIALSVVCLVILGGVAYNKVTPGSSLIAPALDLKVVQSTTTISNLDILKSKIAASQAPAPTNYTEPSLTEAISQDFAQKYINLQNSGNSDIQTQAELINSIAKTYATSSHLTLSLSDISTFPEPDVAKTKAFGNATVKAITKYQETLKKSPIDIINEAETNQTTNDIQLQLRTIATAYRSLGSDLQKIPAPASFEPFYLDVINGYLALGDDVDYMSAYAHDPVKSMIGLNNYQNDWVNQIELLKNFPIYFDSNDILFSNGEEGVRWSSLEY